MNANLATLLEQEAAPTAPASDVPRIGEFIPEVLARYGIECREQSRKPAVQTRTFLVDAGSFAVAELAAW